MTKIKSKIIILGLFATLVASPTLSRAEDTAAKTPAEADQAAPAKTKQHHVPFNGKLVAVDTTVRTLSVGKLTLQITPDTKITKDGKPAALGDGVVGEPVGGAYQKTADGKLNATTIHFGAKAEKQTKETQNAGDNK